MGDIADWDVDRLYDLPDDFLVSDEPYDIPFIRVEHETAKAWLRKYVAAEAAKIRKELISLEGRLIRSYG